MWTRGFATHVTKAFTVRVPATSANLGPGFDTFGMALDVWNDITVSPADEFSMKIEGQGASFLPRGPDNMIVKAAKDAFTTHSQYDDLPPLSFQCSNIIPPARGQGSSSSSLVGGLATGLHLAGLNLKLPSTQDILFQMAAEREGHPDNVAPAVYGGFRFSVTEPTGNHTAYEVPLPASLKTVLFVPDFEMPTKEARAVMPTAVPMHDAVYNIQRATLMIHALHTNQPQLLRTACEDALHQPYRGTLFPLSSLVQSALDAGAHGAWLSGAGSTVCAVVASDDPASTRAIEEAFRVTAQNSELSGTVVSTSPSLHGVYITDSVV